MTGKPCTNPNGHTVIELAGDCIHCGQSGVKVFTTDNVPAGEGDPAALNEKAMATRTKWEHEVSIAPTVPSDAELAEQLRSKLEEACRLIEALEREPRDYEVEVRIVRNDNGQARAYTQITKTVSL